MKKTIIAAEMRVLVAAAATAFGATTWIGMPAAHADENAYMAYLRSHNVTGGQWSDATLLSMGHQECNAMAPPASKPDSFLIDQLESAGYGAARAEDVVFAARNYLC